MSTKNDFILIASQLKKCLEKDTKNLYRFYIDEQLVYEKHEIFSCYIGCLEQMSKNKAKEYIQNIKPYFNENIKAIDYCLNFHEKILSFTKEKKQKELLYTQNGENQYKHPLFLGIKV